MQSKRIKFSNGNYALCRNQYCGHQHPLQWHVTLKKELKRNRLRGIE